MSCSISSMARWPLKPLQEADHALRFLDAHAGHRLVEQQQPRIARQRHGDLELALLAVAERGGRRVGARGEADLVEAASRRLAQALRRGATSARKRKEWPAWACTASATLSSAVNSRSTEVIWKERAEAEPHAGMHRQMGDVAAGEVDGAGVGREVAGELADQRGLAGAVGADQGVDLARPHVDRDVVGGDQAAEALDQAVGGEQRLSHDGDPNRESMPPLA